MEVPGAAPGTAVIVDAGIRLDLVRKHRPSFVFIVLGHRSAEVNNRGRKMAHMIRQLFLCFQFFFFGIEVYTSDNRKKSYLSKIFKSSLPPAGAPPTAVIVDAPAGAAPPTAVMVEPKQ